MLDDLRKSINSFLYERLSSPLYSTLSVSWLIWNWKIIYLTFFISEENICDTKINYILKNYCNSHYLYTGPILSTVIIITLMPFVSNAAFWFSLKFEKWKYDQKNAIERSKLLTIEQSIQIRNEIFQQEEQFSKVLLQKDSDIDLLRRQLSEINNINKNQLDSQNNLRIIRALYGKGDQVINVTNYLNKNIKDNKLDVMINNELFGSQDPTPGFPKDIEIIYEINKKVDTIKGQEGHNIRIN